MDDKTIECWAYITRDEPNWMEVSDLKDWGENGGFYLGKWDGREIILPNNFYKMDRGLQKGGERLFDVCKQM